jgi:hypothetical protein
MADLSSHRHEISGPSEEIDRRIRKHNPDHPLPPGPGRRWNHEAKELSLTNTRPAKTQREVDQGLLPDQSYYLPPHTNTLGRMCARRER